MARFSYVQNKKESSVFSGILPSILLFGAIVLLFALGTASLSSGSEKRQKESLSNALTRDIIYCYATTGHYPESLDAIKKDYGLYYNEDLFYVDYQVRARNIIPDVTIIELQPDDKRPLPVRAVSKVQNFIAGIAQRRFQMKQSILRRSGSQ